MVHRKRTGKATDSEVLKSLEDKRIEVYRVNING